MFIAGVVDKTAPMEYLRGPGGHWFMKKTWSRKSRVRLPLKWRLVGLWITMMTNSILQMWIRFVLNISSLRHERAFPLFLTHVCSFCFYRKMPSNRSRQYCLTKSRMVLHNGEVYNGCITNGLCSYKLSLDDNTNIIQNMTKSSTFFYNSHLLSSISCETISLYETYNDLCKQRFVMQPLQNPTLCYSTKRRFWARELGIFKTVYYMYHTKRQIWNRSVI